jgi:hypothetical protein
MNLLTNELSTILFYPDKNIRGSQDGTGWLRMILGPE